MTDTITDTIKTYWKPWGSYKVLQESLTHKVKQLAVQPHHQLSLQKHEHRSEHWVVVKGTATVQLNEHMMILEEGQSVDIPAKSVHSLANNTGDLLVIIETQTGTYFGEDDIVRLEDPYNRKET